MANETTISQREFPVVENKEGDFAQNSRDLGQLRQLLWKPLSLEALSRMAENPFLVPDDADVPELAAAKAELLADLRSKISYHKAQEEASAKVADIIATAA